MGLLSSILSGQEAQTSCKLNAGLSSQVCAATLHLQLAWLPSGDTAPLVSMQPGEEVGMSN